MDNTGINSEPLNNDQSNTLQQPMKMVDVFGDEYELDSNGKCKVNGWCDWLL